MPVPDFSPGEVLTAAAMDSIGLWLVKTQTVGTAVSSVNVTGAFSADYDNYRITYTGGTMSVETALMMTFGATTTNYYGSFVHGSYIGSGNASFNGDNNVARFGFVGGSTQPNVSIDVFTPFLTRYTDINARTRYSTFWGTYQGLLLNSTSYTDFTLTPNTGTMTGGTIRVYGYRN